MYQVCLHVLGMLWGAFGLMVRSSSRKFCQFFVEVELILAANAVFPTCEDMVNCLLHYIGLDNSEFVSDHIKVGKGRQTQGKINYVSAHEAKTIGREHLETDLSYKRMRGSNFSKAVLKPF